jgi:hypothetical protein
MGRISSDMLKLAPNSVFGCFAESLTLYHAIYREHQYSLLEQNWFYVNRLNIAVLSYNFDALQVNSAPAYCFGQKLTSFCLERDCSKMKTTGRNLAPVGKTALST